jgi:hypothetical protein
MEVGQENWPVLRLGWQNTPSPWLMERSVEKEYVPKPPTCQMMSNDVHVNHYQESQRGESSADSHPDLPKTRSTKSRYVSITHGVIMENVYDIVGGHLLTR